jgi:hypothetical protein
VWYAGLDGTVWQFHLNLYGVTYTRGCTDTIDSPDDEHLVARNIQRIGINKYNKKNCTSNWLFTKIVIIRTVKKHKNQITYLQFLHAETFTTQRREF